LLGLIWLLLLPSDSSETRFFGGRRERNSDPGSTILTRLLLHPTSPDSVMTNTETDIIPRYGFIHKPSTLWPVPAVSSNESPDDPRSDASGDPKSSNEPSLKVAQGVDDRESSQSSKEGAAAAEVHSSGKKAGKSKGRSQATASDNIPALPSRLRSEPVKVPVSSAPSGFVELKSE